MKAILFTSFAFALLKYEKSVKYWDFLQLNGDVIRKGIEVE